MKKQEARKEEEEEEEGAKNRFAPHMNKPYYAGV
jgi:hypothetical protein